jgi:threonine/homoserine/homoserine lactone efflux protein
VGGAVAGSVGYALGIAISPIPIAALVLTLLSVRPRANSLAFGVGWVVGVAGVAAIAAATPLFGGGDEPGDARGWIRLTIGVVLIVAGARRWRTRPGPDDEPPIPPLLRAIDRTGTAGVAGIGFALAAFNPKDLVLAATGGAEIAAADLSTGTTIAAVAVFAAIASSTVVVPVIASLLAGDRLDDRLHRARDWLVRHNAVVMAVVLVAVGVLFVIEGGQILMD